MRHFDSLEKGGGIVSLIQFVYEFSRKACHTQLIDQIIFPDCLYFFTCWSICVLQLFVNETVTLQILKLNLSL